MPFAGSSGSIGTSMLLVCTRPLSPKSVHVNVGGALPVVVLGPCSPPVVCCDDEPGVTWLSLAHAAMNRATATMARGRARMSAG